MLNCLQITFVIVFQIHYALVDCVALLFYNVGIQFVRTAYAHLSVRVIK
jgi:hypothetical protein